MYLTVIQYMWELTVRARAGNLLIGFPSESLVFCPKMSLLVTWRSGSIAATGSIAETSVSARG